MTRDTESKGSKTAADTLKPRGTAKIAGFMPMLAAMATTGGSTTVTMGVFTGMTKWMRMVNRDTNAMTTIRGNVFSPPCRGAVFPQGHAEGVGGADKEKNIPTYFAAIFFPSDQSDSGQGEEHAPQHGSGGQWEAMRAG